MPWPGAALPIHHRSPFTSASPRTWPAQLPGSASRIRTLAAGFAPAMGAPTHRPPTAHGFAAADQPLPPAHRVRSHPPRWPPAHSPVPLVLDSVLDLSHSESITWVRTTLESLPEGLPLRLWWSSLQTGGLLKWLILQLLSKLAIPRLRRAGLQTNRRFAGVLFQWINVRQSLSPLLGKGLQLNHCGTCFTAGCSDPSSPP